MLMSKFSSSAAFLSFFNFFLVSFALKKEKKKIMNKHCSCFCGVVDWGGLVVRY